MLKEKFKFMLKEEFKIRTNEETKEIGVKEEYKCIRDGDTYSITATLGFDRTLTPTKPALYGKHGYIPVSECTNIEDIEATEEFLSQKRGVYTILQTTMLMCVVKGRIRNGAWLKTSTCDFYLPYEANGTTELIGIKICKGTVLGSLSFDNEDELKELAFNLILDTYPSKAELIRRRFNKGEAVKVNTELNTSDIKEDIDKDKI